MTEVEIFAYASKHISYDPDTGSLRWIPREVAKAQDIAWNTRYANKECGNISDGYVKIVMKKNERRLRIRAHRFCWYFCYGEPPNGVIDHINQIRSDNRISNLRDVDRKTNQRNTKLRVDNTSGYVGVTYHKQSQKWMAQANMGGKCHFLGLFENAEDASIASKKFRSENGYTELHGESK